jgi:hypothetical protein
MKTRNHVARAAWKFNKPKVYRAKKGKGSYVRSKKRGLVEISKHELLSC